LVSDADANAIVEAWLTTPFDGGRHAGRVAKLTALDGTPAALDENDQNGRNK
jgi:ribose 5-phosphate isomerase RpiB